MADILPNGTKVTWSSQGSGNENTITGIIKAFIPKNAGCLHPDIQSAYQYLESISFNRQNFRLVHGGIRDAYLVEVPRPRGKKGNGCGVDVYKPLCSQVIVVEEE